VRRTVADAFIPAVSASLAHLEKDNKKRRRAGGVLGLFAVTRLVVELWSCSTIS